MQTEESNPAETRSRLIAENKLTLDAVFVPFSQSRNKAEKHLSLNWKVTLKRDGREVLTTDYSQGIGHAPSYKKSPRFYPGQHVEAETGRKARPDWSGGAFPSKDRIEPPRLEDVLYSLLLDSDVIDHPGFESWASEFGYDADSRAAEKTYRACLALGLQLRAALGGPAMAALRDAFSDY